MSTKIWVHAASAAVLIIGLAVSGAAAHEHPEMCGEIRDGSGNPVRQSDGDIVLFSGSAPCPEPVAAAPAAVVPTVEPLPHDGTVHFAFDVAEPDEAEQIVLNQIVRAVTEQSPSKVTVSGYADTAGPPAYNETLSQRRADNVAAALTEAGIPASAVSTAAHGEQNLAVQTDDGVPMRANRRAVIAIGE